MINDAGEDVGKPSLQFAGDAPVNTRDYIGPACLDNLRTSVQVGSSPCIGSGLGELLPDCCAIARSALFAACGTNLSFAFCPHDSLGDVLLSHLPLVLS
jgi:hypothetical protein